MMGVATLRCSESRKKRDTVSFPIALGEHQRIAVKVMDFRGNEVVRVVSLDRGQYL